MRAIGVHRSSLSLQQGALLVILSGLMFALAGTCAKVASAEVSAFPLVFWRNLFSFLIVLAMLAPGRFRGMETARLDLHILRSVLTYLALLTYFWSVSQVSLVDAVLLRDLAPVFVPVLGWVFLKKISERSVWIGVGLGFLGCVLIIHPTLSGVSPGHLSGIASGAAGGGATVAIWAMSGTEPPSRQMLYFTSFTLLISIVMLPWTWQLPSAYSMSFLLMLSAFTTAAQYLLSAAFALGPADKTNTWLYTSVIFSAIIGYVGWGEVITSYFVIGAAFIIYGAFLATRPSKEARARQ